MDVAPEDGEDHSAGGDDTSGASDAEGVGGETAGGGVEGGDPLGGGGGGSLGDVLGGGSDPGGLMGADPAAGGGGEEEALMELVAALDELGIPIEELAGAGGGMGPEASGMGAPPMGGDPMAGGPDGGMPPGADMGGPADPMGGMTEGMKLASAAKAFKRSGKYRLKAAANGSPQRALREQMKSHILELMQ